MKQAKGIPVKKKGKARQAPKKEYSFFENVYDVVRLVPRGRVTSYGAIAKYLGSGRSARLVGYAMNACATEIPPVPAQRVLNRNGVLTGKHHFNPPERMEKLLAAEGIKVVKDKVVNFKNIFWDPLLEL